MRSTERRLPRVAIRSILPWALLAAAAGCSTPHPAPGPAAEKPALPASKDAGTDAGRQAGKARAESMEGAVSPAVQRAYDAALDALNAGRRGEAEHALQALAKSEPDLGGPHANLGIIYRQAGKLPESAAELEQAVRANANQPVYWNQLGITYRQSGDFGKARDAYEKAIALDPSYAVPYLNLGILFDLYFWDSKRALELYDRFLTLTPGGDERVFKWIADLKNRVAKADAASRKERE
jgi:tetratricopeptide (TPR) repeat protein